MSLLGVGLWFEIAVETSESDEARKGDKEPLLVRLRSWCSWQLSLTTDIWK